MSGAMLALALLSAALAAARGLQVPRCCRDGERLDLDKLPDAELSADQAAAACAPAEPGAAAWAPRVFAPARGVFLGRLPVHWRATETALPACARLRALPDHAAVYALLANNASLHVRGAAAAVPPDRYCADVGAALVCADAATRAPSKCCGGGGRAWDGTRCVAGEEAATAAAAATAQLTRLAGAAPGGGWPACAGSRYAVAGALGGAALQADGALQLAGGAVLAAGAWCAEAVLGAGARVLACEAAAGAGGVAGARHAVYGAALAVGALFLAATLAASLMLPAAHHALHWRCQTHYVAALMLGDALLAATQLAGAAVPPGLCRALAVLMHFLFLSAFFWLNTMCFNIWWTFRDFRPTSLERGQEAWRLRVYSLYAWGAPLLLAGAGALLDAWPGGAGAALLRPRFGEQRCWFYGDTEILVYFFGPVGVLLLVNLALFASTTRQLTCGLWRRDEVKSTAERAALGRVCAKLVVVMGVTWGADVASWALGGPDYVWYATDLLNALQGVLIFLVVGCQRHSLAGAAACWRRVRGGDAGRGGGGGAHRHTHSSTQLPSCGESLTHTSAAPASHTTTTAGAGSTAPPAPGKLPMETVC